MSLFFAAALYFYARGLFALFGRTIFYTKRTLALIEPENLSAYLKESGIWHMAAGTVFVGKALLDIVFPQNKVLLAIFFVLLIVCVIFLSRSNERYIKK